MRPYFSSARLDDAQFILTVYPFFAGPLQRTATGARRAMIACTVPQVDSCLSPTLARSAFWLSPLPIRAVAF